jgi:elongation factor 1 alpha-like protein
MTVAHLQVDWSQDRYDDIVDALRPFLASAGFAASKTTFLPIAAMDGVNMLANDDPKLKEWYDGPTLIDTLGWCTISHCRPC